MGDEADAGIRFQAEITWPRLVWGEAERDMRRKTWDEVPAEGGPVAVRVPTRIRD
jgi:hypothetical protein